MGGNPNGIDSFLSELEMEIYMPTLDYGSDSIIPNFERMEMDSFFFVSHIE